MDCFASLAMTLKKVHTFSKHLEIFAVFPVRHLGLEALEFGALDVNVVIDKAGAERLAEKRIVLERDHRFPQALRQERGFRFVRRIGGRTGIERAIDAALKELLAS